MRSRVLERFASLKFMGSPGRCDRFQTKDPAKAR
jgi:hypothetical protein